MNPPRKLVSQQQNQDEQSLTQAQQSNTQQAAEFPSVEALLRHDALHTPVPPTVAQRLEHSLAPLKPASRRWWRRWLGS